MGLIGKLKKKVGQAAGVLEDTGGAAKAVAERGAYVARRSPVVFGKTLASESQAELADPNSSASRFMRAPAGQYYLPGPAKSALGLLLPSPRTTIQTNKAAVQNPTNPRAVGAAALTDFQILSTPAAVSGGARLAAAAPRGINAVAERGVLRTLASESGAKNIGGIAGKKTITQVVEDAGAKRAAAKTLTAPATAAKTEFVGNKIAGERVASTALADEAATQTRASRLSKVPSEALATSNSPASRAARASRVENAPGAPGGRTKAPTSPDVIKALGIEPARVPQSRAYSRVSEAARPAAKVTAGPVTNEQLAKLPGGTASKRGSFSSPANRQAAGEALGISGPKPETVAARATIKPAPGVFQKMPDATLHQMAEHGVKGAIEERAARASAASTPKPALSTTPKASPEPAAQAAAPTVNKLNKSGGLGLPSKTNREAAAAQHIAETPAPKATKAPKQGANPNYSQKNGPVKTTKNPAAVSELPANTPPPPSAKAPQAQSSIGPQPTPRKGESVGSFSARLDQWNFRKAHPTPSIAEQAPRPKGGSTKGAPRGAAVKRSTTPAFENALAAAGEKPAGEVATRTIKTKTASTKTAPQTETPPPPKTSPAAAGASGGDGGGGGPRRTGPGIAAGEPATPGSAAATVAKKGVFGNAKTVAKFGVKTAKTAGLVGLTGLGVFTAVSQLRGTPEPVGNQGNQAVNTTPVPTGITLKPTQTIDDAINNIGDETLRNNLKGLRAVQTEKGEAGLEALRIGAKEAQASGEMPDISELNYPAQNPKYANDVAALKNQGKSPGEIQLRLIDKARKRRDETLKKHVKAAEDAIKTRAKLEAARKLNAQ